MKRSVSPPPIGFYFARLWYFERLYSMIFMTSALDRAKEVTRNGGDLFSSTDSDR